MKRAILFLVFLSLPACVSAGELADFPMTRDIDRIGEVWSQRRRDRLEQVNAEALMSAYPAWRAHTLYGFEAWYARTFYTYPQRTARVRRTR